MRASPGWQRFARWSAHLGLPLTERQLEQFREYLTLLLAWNERINLTAVRQPEEILVRHFLDSLSCARVTGDLNHSRLIDVGTGAGFPGLPLKIAYPELKLTLVESIAKKGKFLQEVVGALGLSQVTIELERAEELGQMANHRQQYDWALARAVAELRVLAEYLLPFCRVGGKMLAQKGERIQMELAEAKAAIHLLGGGEPQLTSISLPELSQRYYLLEVEKVRETPAQYPRRVGVPGKRPL